MSATGEEPTKTPSNTGEAPKTPSNTGEAKADEAKTESEAPAKAKSGVAEEAKEGDAKKEETKEGEAKKEEAEGETKKEEGVKKTASKKSAKKAARRGKGEKATVDNCKIGILGTGKMAEAICKGLIFNKFGADRIYVSSKNGKTHDNFKQLGVSVHKKIYDLFGRNECDIIFLAVHGYTIKECFKMGGQRPMALTTNYIPNRPMPYYILSLVGGITIEDCKKVLLSPDHPEKYKAEFHRIVLNTACAFGVGLGAIDAEIDSKKVTPIIRDLLVKIAKIEFFPEANMDVVCAVGGNGLAFVYYYLAALSDGGFKMGLPKKVAVNLACKTLNSAASALLESGKTTADLRDCATAASGPTIFGLAALDKKDCASGISNAVEAAFKRIRELCDKNINQ